MTNSPIPTLLTPQAVADIFGETKKTVIERARHGEIGCYRWGREIRFSPEHVAEYLASHEAKVGRPSEVGRKPRVSARAEAELRKSA
ncbi:helix-turn-helix domain-containing protein [Kineosporia succinea]|uniref:Excisionase family DNA binding protein n=1 Tax=Kineosporia succinea TaxID=84632 RepID=A0ABT9NXP4_9ACTN|nr:helix-turn-helix domain-containing protein [Kineosporia succinea]MDP9825189.1 excisionase family DNA binding protein [Kineosporia succinea]